MKRKASKVFYFFVIFFVSLVLASCHTPSTITKTVVLHDTITNTQVLRDSIMVDNYIKEYIKGDTVFVDRVQTKYVERLKTDTVRLFTEVPTETTIEVEKVVERPLKWHEQALQTIGLIALSIVVTLVIFRCIFGKLGKI